MAQGGAQRSCLFVCLLLAWVQACYWRAGLLTPSGPKRKQLCEPPSQPAASPACPPASCPAAGFMIVREGEPVFMSPQQQHEFNFPFQIGSADSMSDLPQVRTGRGAWRCLACHAPASQRTGRVPGVPGLLCEGWIPAGSIRLPPASCRPISSLLRLPSSHYLPPFPPLPIHTYTHTHIHTQVAQRFSLDVREGDILVVATDGLFDNVYPDEAAALVSATKVGGRLCVLLVCAVVWGNRVGLGLLTWRMGD